MECREQKVRLEMGSGGCFQRHRGFNTRVGKSARRRLAMEKANWTDSSFFSAVVFIFNHETQFRKRVRE